MTGFSYIIWYLFIGTVLQLIWDWIDRYLTVERYTDVLNDWDRLLSILIWPIGLFVFLYSFLTSYYNKDDD